VAWYERYSERWTWLIPLGAVLLLFAGAFLAWLIKPGNTEYIRLKAGTVTVVQTTPAPPVKTQTQTIVVQGTVKVLAPSLHPDSTSPSEQAQSEPYNPKAQDCHANDAGNISPMAQGCLAGPPP
jgi:hypothetical protein